ncbi:MAG: ELM1/GtrOC1 family putative glycosyltransferase [Candidatus Omnitrophica bacterium]|nr:ELM1/GtrOC1 family putative glycosyltransferase [Candidatus Omnitrophota bacterium]
MKMSFLLDYLACILFKVLGALFRFLPVGLALFVGRRLGDWFYYFDARHRARSYANIKIALGQSLSPKAICRLTKEFYQSFGQSLIEIFLIPKVDKAYLDKYVEAEGAENIYAGLKKGRGAVLISVHAGSWELANIICANYGFPFYLFVKDQDFPRLNKLLNSYRQAKGCRIITKEGGLKQLIEALKNNSAVGITLDQGGKAGELVEFFGRIASMSTGGIKIALKYDTAIIPVYFTREKGPKIKVFVGKELELTKTGDAERDVKDNLKKVTQVFEDFIRKYPKEYLWTYKIWKYSDEKNILILSDGKAGHLRQSEALSRIVSERLENKGMRVKVETIEVKFKNKLARPLFSLSSLLAGKYSCQGCLWCLRRLLQADTYARLASSRPDMVISCGSSLAPVNFIVARETQARSMVIMRPPFLSRKRFDLIIIPQHDHPPKKKNVVATKGALNLIDQRYLEEQSAALAKNYNLNPGALYIGLLLGGDSKKFRLHKDLVARLASEVKSVAEKLDASILLTTSRRTPPEVENLLKQEFRAYPRCKLMVIANERNIPQAVGGILALSKLVITSPESISMISEAANSGKFVLAFKSAGLSRKHREFLQNLADGRYIYLSAVEALGRTMESILRDNPPVKILADRDLVAKAIEKIW